MKTEIKIKRGKELSIEFIKEWNKIMKKEFKENKPLSPENRRKFENDIFFILQNDKKELLSVARLKSIKITFLGKSYYITGIADMVSIIKRRGYGKKVVRKIIDYIKKRKKTQVSFCHPKNIKFYRKCGMKIIKDGVKRFYYKDRKGRIHHNPWDKDLFYIEGKDNFVKEIIYNPKEKIKLPINFY